MKHNRIIFIIAFVLIIANSCTAMEITTPQKITSLVFSDNNTLVVGRENGCGIFNAQSQKLIHKLTANNVSNLVADNNIVALISCNKAKKTSPYELIVFDKETGEQLWLKDGYYPPNSCSRAVFNCSSKLAISPIDSTLFVSTNDVLTTYDYIKQQTHYTDKSFKLGVWSPFVTCHPTENTVLFSDGRQWLYTAQLDPEPFVNLTINVIRSGTELECGMYLHHTNGQYSADGAAVAFNNIRDEYFVCNLQEKRSIAYELLPPANKTFLALSFYPRARILALLSDDYVVHYCDYKSRTAVAETHPLLDNALIKTSNEQLTFSPDGTQLAFSSQDQWFTIQAPDFTTNFAMIYVLLKHAPIVPNKQIPVVIKNITQLATQHAKLSYINIPALVKVAPLPEQNTLSDTESSEQLIYKSLCTTKKLKV